MSERKKILWVSHFLPYPPKGGAQMRSFNLIKQLSIYHDVYLYCVVDSSKLNSYFLNPADGICEAKKEFGAFCHEVIFCVLPKMSKAGKAISLIKSIFLNKSYSSCIIDREEISNFINSIDINFFDCVHLDTISLTNFIDKFAGKNIYLNHHNIESDMMLRRYEKEDNWLKKMVFKQDAKKIKALEVGSSRHIFKHFVCSRLDEVRLNNIITGISTKVIENGINANASVTNRISYNKSSALFIGGLDWYPNSDAVVFLLKEVLPLLKEQNINIHVDIVGKNPSKEIINYSAAYDCIKLHGFVNDISEFYDRCGFFICPIRDGGGTKLKILEAMANGIPILAHPIALEGIDATPGMHYLAATTPMEFVEQILAIKEMDDIYLQQISINAKTLVEAKYNYLEIGKRLSAAYL